MNVRRNLARVSILAGVLAVAPRAGAQATPAPAPAAPAAAQPDPQTKATLEDIHARNVSAIQYSEIAGQKATSPSMKQFAAKARADHARLDAELKAIAAERGIQLTPDATIAQAPQLKGVLDQLRATAGGPEFDRQYAEATVADRTRQVDELKALRDRTPAKDARLKKWLDDAENVMEEHRNQARVALKEVSTQQRQGRTPPK